MLVNTYKMYACLPCVFDLTCFDFLSHSCCACFTHISLNVPLRPQRLVYDAGKRNSVRPIWASCCSIDIARPTSTLSIFVAVTRCCITIWSMPRTTKVSCDYDSHGSPKVYFATWVSERGWEEVKGDLFSKAVPILCHIFTATVQVVRAFTSSCRRSGSESTRSGPLTKRASTGIWWVTCGCQKRRVLKCR